MTTLDRAVTLHSDSALQIILEATDCRPSQARALIAALVAAGWMPPGPCVDGDEPQESLAENGELPTDDTPALPAERWVAHTDGACSGNPGPGGWAVVFSQGDVVHEELSGYEPDSTNNRMELTAIREAIGQAPPGVMLEIVTDSANAIGWLAGGWKRKDPLIGLLCGQIDVLRKHRANAHGGKDDNVSFRHVLGHNGDLLNERADKLAVAASKERY